MNKPALKTKTFLFYCIHIGVLTYFVNAIIASFFTKTEEILHAIFETKMTLEFSEFIVRML